ncbi:MAG: alpha/beta fold hydrolase [Halococcoides sp.]
MSLKRFLGATAGAVGLAAAGNYWLRCRAGPLGPPLGGTDRSLDWRGFEIACRELGDPDDPDLVCLHGIHAAASSHEFADVAEALAAEYHVIAPDLLGFGRSDRPRIEYTPAIYSGVIETVLAATEAPTVLASSLSAAYVAASDAELAELVAVCPTDRTMALSGARTILAVPVVGRTAFNVLVSRPAIRYCYADHGVADPDAIDPLRVEYDWRSAHQSGARWAPAAFLEGALQPDRSLETLFGDLDAPVRVFWGQAADLPGLDRGRALTEAVGGELVIFEDAALLPHVECPDRFVAAVAGHGRNDAAKPQD